MIPRPPCCLPRFASLLLLALAGSGAVRAQDARPVVDAATVKNEKAANNNLPTMFVVGVSTSGYDNGTLP